MAISREKFLIKDTINSAEFKSKIYSYRDQERIRNGWLKKRFDEVLPMLMERSGIDLWVVCCREYNEDPVLTTLVPVSMMSARRTTILVFYLQPDKTVKRMALTRPGVGLDDYYEAVWTNPKNSNWSDGKSLLPDGKDVKPASKPETQFECLARIIKECNPKKVGLNISQDYAFADGLSKQLYDEMVAEFDEDIKAKITSAADLCVGWLETRTEEELAAYTGIMQIAHGIIDEAFSSRVIIPGVTTNADVKYFMLQRTIDLGLTPWFDYEVSIRRAKVGEIYHEAIIMPGDLLHCDIGFRYLNLCTDTQENAYVLKMDETEAPAYLTHALKVVNRLQDITISSFKEHLTGNQILAKALAKAKDEGINACIYTHPINHHGHGAGPTIGLWDMQNGVKGTGDYPLYNNTLYSLELNAKVDIPQWDMVLTLGAETDIMFANDRVFYVAGRQEQFHLIK